MSFQEIMLKPSYDSDEDDILNAFYKPVLQHSISYYRLAGFFSSSILAAASQGILGLIRNNGRMKLVVGARLNKNDLLAIENGLKKREETVIESLNLELDSLGHELMEDHVRALGWMVAKGLLEIKVAIPLSTKDGRIDNSALFHMKIGILEDKQGNALSFSGSVNETRMGWLKHTEEFKVFRRWKEGERGYFESDLIRFQKYWNGQASNTLVMDIPPAIRARLIQLAPKNIDEIPLETHEKRFRRKPWDCQVKAIQKWVENDFKGILAMATGSGKTLAALYASTLNSRSVVTLVLVPTIPLLEQWADDNIPDFDETAKVIKCGDVHKEWERLIPLELARCRRKDIKTPDGRLYIVAINATARSEKFLSLWKGIPPDYVQVICDEVHHIGATTNQNTMKIPSSRRLGLSATPVRQWDRVGTDKIFEYYGKMIYKYSIEDAIKDGRLCKYEYHPHFAYLTQDEFDDFHGFTDDIEVEFARLRSKKKRLGTDDDPENDGIPTSKRLERLLRDRARVKKKATDKPRAFKKVLDSIEERPLLVFCEDNEQLDDIKYITQQKSSRFAIYTSKLNPKQRSETIEMFEDGTIDLILAIRCLDEGLDVPDCRGCIIIASSSSERQFIQRRGRILRKNTPNKIAMLNDIITMPPSITTSTQKEVARKLVQQELNRVFELVKSSENEWDVRDIIRRELRKFGLEELASQ